MKFKNKLAIASCLLVLFFPISSFSLNPDQDDTFQAEGLTEPVVPKVGDIAVKVTFPQTDYYMLFDPPSG